MKLFIKLLILLFSTHIFAMNKQKNKQENKLLDSILKYTEDNNQFINEYNKISKKITYNTTFKLIKKLSKKDAINFTLIKHIIEHSEHKNILSIKIKIETITERDKKKRHSINRYHTLGQELFKKAIEQKDQTMIEFLLSKNTNCLEPIFTIDNRHLLSYLLQNGYYTIAKNIINKHNNNDFKGIVGAQALYALVLHDEQDGISSIDIANLLINKGSDINFSIDNQSLNNALTAAISCWNFNLLNFFINTNKAKIKDINYINYLHKQHLWFEDDIDRKNKTSQFNIEKIFNLLLEKGAIFKTDSVFFHHVVEAAKEENLTYFFSPQYKPLLKLFFPKLDNEKLNLLKNYRNSKIKAYIENNQKELKELDNKISTLKQDIKTIKIQEALINDQTDLPPSLSYNDIRLLLEAGVEPKLTSKLNNIDKKELNDGIYYDNGTANIIFNISQKDHKKFKLYVEEFGANWAFISKSKVNIFHAILNDPSSPAENLELVLEKLKGFDQEVIKKYIFAKSNKFNSPLELAIEAISTLSEKEIDLIKNSATKLRILFEWLNNKNLDNIINTIIDTLYAQLKDPTRIDIIFHFIEKFGNGKEIVLKLYGNDKIQKLFENKKNSLKKESEEENKQKLIDAFWKKINDINTDTSIELVTKIINFSLNNSYIKDNNEIITTLIKNKNWTALSRILDAIYKGNKNYLFDKILLTKEKDIVNHFIDKFGVNNKYIDSKKTILEHAIDLKDNDLIEIVLHKHPLLTNNLLNEINKICSNKIFNFAITIYDKQNFTNSNNSNKISKKKIGHKRLKQSVILGNYNKTNTENIKNTTENIDTEIFTWDIDGETHYSDHKNIKYEWGFYLMIDPKLVFDSRFETKFYDYLYFAPKEDPVGIHANKNKTIYRIKTVSNGLRIHGDFHENKAGKKLLFFHTILSHDESDRLMKKGIQINKLPSNSSSFNNTKDSDNFVIDENIKKFLNESNSLCIENSTNGNLIDIYDDNDDDDLDYNNLDFFLESDPDEVWKDFREYKVKEKINN
jgi:hypothetical protein